MVEDEWEDNEAPVMLGAPERIWLVVGEVGGDERFDELAEVTWRRDRVLDADIEYVRADLVREAMPANYADTLALAQALGIDKTGAPPE